ncbi:MAG: glycosyltransferase [bacterium]
MKILQVNKFYYPVIGGIETTLRQITQGLSSRHDMNILCCTRKGSSSVEKIDTANVYRTASFGVFWGMPISLDFFRTFKKVSQDADVIVSHYPFPLFDIALFLYRPQKPLVVHYHCDVYRQRMVMPIINFFVNFSLRRAKKIIVESPNILNSSPTLRAYKDKCVVVNCGIEKDRFSSVSKEKIEECKKKYGDFVLFVGRLSPYKGVEYLIRAMKDIDKNLVIVGDGEEKEKLIALSLELGLENKIHFISHQSFEDLNTMYCACYIFVLPSIYRSEALGLVLLEAMFAGKPVISTELGTGTSYVNMDNETGFVVPPMDSESLHTAIKKIYSDNDLYNRFSKNAHERVVNHFNIEDMTKKTNDVYTSV